MCRPGTTAEVMVKTLTNPVAMGEEKWKREPIDSCIADVVEALQVGGIDMRGSCCGHGKDFGGIVLQDGRILSICPAADYRSLRWAARAAWQIIRNWRKR